MKKRLLVLTSILAISLTLQACENSSKAVNTTADTTKTESQENKNDNKKVEKPNLQSYQELTAYAKKQTSKFSKIMTDYNIDNVLTPDNMYAVNTKQTYKKYDKDYEFHAEYLYNTDFSNTSNDGDMHIRYTKNIDDTFSEEDNYMKFITEVINEMFDGENITTDELINALNDADTEAKKQRTHHGINGYSEERKLDKKNISVWVTYLDSGSNVTVFDFGKHDNFDIYKLASPQKTYDTVNSFLDNNSKKQQLTDFFVQSGFKGVYNQDSKDKDVIKVNCETNDHSEGFSDDYYVSCKVLNYDLKNPSNDSIKVLYNFIKTFTLNTDLSEEEFENYINSRILYDIYQFDPRELGNVSGEGFPYYMPLVNVAKNENTPSKYPAFDVSFDGKIDRNSIKIESGNNQENATKLTNVNINIQFKVPVVAEGITKR
ncbi:hypothetical protein [Clostridium beijerinckii]|uniref:Lipoprotein n=1 Tax=Clostridium beijerinckii TaxID=1520 RepID=A0A1S8S1F3_CLOBE|nr:hypothetical protein [Clostridium beijerinckii]NRY60669.1 hypothetical protein [Clostridium beijerinckii]OOM59288.1 hypothetical protein CLBCK_35870 [Clostridium beijerinckii]